MKKITCGLAVILAFSSLPNVFAQQAKKEKEKKETKIDSVDSSKGKLKPFKEIITDKAVSQNGMMNVHKLEGRYFFEIPDSILGRDILVVNRIAGAPAGLRPQKHIYGGDQIAENVIAFEKGPDNKIFLKRRIFIERGLDSSENGMYRSLMNSNVQPIAAAFDIKANGQQQDHKSYVIDVTDFINQDNEVLYFNEKSKKDLGIGAFQADKSYIDKIQSFPINVELHTVRSYTVGGSSSSLPLTYSLNSSFVLLPKEPMKARLADARVGFFSRGFIDFDNNPQGVKNSSYITRWRLEPKAEDVEKYLQGELVEPKKPIVFYIDPATPKKWVPYLIAGVNDWQEAFEAAGFKNAIRAQEAPVEDSTWNINDARNSAIIYKPSSIPNASGPHVHDPRSGEIIESHINWYHNIMYLLKNWYTIQAGAIDKNAQKPQLDDELMGELIRFVSSHEVGHTLGLMHNFGSSSTVPVDSLRSRTFTERYGHTPSIMDYARFNYVAQPEDNISTKGIFPRIGDYDKWAISWGYRWLPEFKTAEEELAYQNKLIIDSLTANPRYFFGSEFEFTDPRSQSEDLGDDAVKANTYGIKNLQRILPNILAWSKVENEGYENAANLYKTLLQQFKLYNVQVLKIVAGQYHNIGSVEQELPVYEPVPYEQQKRAMRFLDEQLFQTPEWLINDSLRTLTNHNAYGDIHAAQDAVLFRLLGSRVILTMIEQTIDQNHKEKQYNIDEYLTDLRQSVWSELYNKDEISKPRRSLQKSYLRQAFRSFIATTEIVGRNDGNGNIFYTNPDPTGEDVHSVMREHLINLQKDIKKAAKHKKGFSKLHLEDMYRRISEKLEEGITVPKQ